MIYPLGILAEFAFWLFFPSVLLSNALVLPMNLRVERSAGRDKGRGRGSASAEGDDGDAAMSMPSGGARFCPVCRSSELEGRRDRPRRPEDSRRR